MKIKFTSEDLMKAMGLQVGDRIKLGKQILSIVRKDEDIYYQTEKGYFYSIIILIEQEFEILPKPKRVGDLKCGDFECSQCPLNLICCLSTICDTEKISLNEIFKSADIENVDKEIHDLLKARLDKEVLEDEKH